MDNQEMIIDNVNLDLVLRVFSNINNEEFREQLRLQRDKFKKEENYIIDGVLENSSKLATYQKATTREALMEMFESTLEEGNKEIMEREVAGNWGLDSFGLDVDMDDFELDDLELGDMSLDDLVQDIEDIEQDESISLENTEPVGVTIAAKKMVIEENGHSFDIHFLENDERTLGIFGKEPHKMAFLWTYPELKPVLNIPALIRLMDVTKVVDCQVSTDYKDPDLIEYRLIKGLLALAVKGGSKQ